MGEVAIGPEPTCIIACGMLAREVLALKARLGLDHLRVTCLPAQLHYRPEGIPAAMEAAILAARADGFARILAGYADCGTGGRLDEVLARHGVERLAGPHCFASWQGLAAFEAEPDADMRAFWFTDFLARHPDSFFWKPLGLDRHPELAPMYFGHYERLVYLAQTDDPALDAVARDAASRLGLAYERRLTGYGDVEAFLAGAAA